MTARGSAPRTETNTPLIAAEDGSEFTCTFGTFSPLLPKQSVCFSDSGNNIRAHDDEMIHALFFLLLAFLAALSLPLTPSQLENEDVKVKIKTIICINMYYLLIQKR